MGCERRMMWVVQLGEDERSRVEAALRGVGIEDDDLERAMLSRVADLEDSINVEALFHEGQGEVGEFFRVTEAGGKKTVVAEGYLYTVGESSIDREDETWRLVEYSGLEAPFDAVAEQGICKWIESEGPCVTQYITDMTETEAHAFARGCIGGEKGATPVRGDEISRLMPCGFYILKPDK